MVTLDEFKGTIYYTRQYVVLPLLNIKLNKTAYFKKGRYNQAEVDKHVELIYKEKYGEEE